MQEKINTIREACIKANPSIMDLVFGCEVLYKKTNIIKTCVGRFEADTLTLDFRNGMPQILMMDGYMNPDLTEILGRPIRLADVLLAISKTLKFASSEGCKIQLGVATLHFIDKTNLVKWDFKNDSLIEQPEETIDFIYNLLK